jgi:hypothetical protein
MATKTKPIAKSQLEPNTADLTTLDTPNGPALFVSDPSLTGADGAATVPPAYPVGTPPPASGFKFSKITVVAVVLSAVALVVLIVHHFTGEKK